MKTFFYKCSNSRVYESTPQPIYGNKVVGASNASPEIPLPKNLSRKIARFFVSKIGPATGVTPVAGPILETKNRAIFLERFFDFSGEEFREKHYCPYNFVPINWLWSGFIFPELEHL